jgi:hypothetical protein
MSDLNDKQAVVDPPDLEPQASPEPSISEPAVRPAWRVLLERALYSKALFFVLVGSALAWAGWQHFAAGGLPVHSEVVVFDPIKLANAERAVASQFLAKDGDIGSAGLLLAKVRKEAEGVIRDVAGPDAMVLVRQAVVVNQYPDITDRVLVRLGLPTDVPTTADILYAEDEAPTAYSGAASRQAGDPKQFTLESMAERMRKGGDNAALVP